MNNLIAFTIMIGIIVLGGLYMIWWMERQERKEEKYNQSQQH